MIEQVHKNYSQTPRDDLRSEGLSAVGRELKEAREALGISVAEMANALRIRSVHIDSLEGGRFDELPGRPYTLGFARSMATHLGLDPDAVSMRLRDEVTGAAAPVELIFPESTEDKRLSRAGWIAISLALIAIAYGAWLALSPRRDAGPPEFASVKTGSTPPAPTTSAEPEPSADAVDDNSPEAAAVTAPPVSPPASVVPSVPVPPPAAAKPPAAVVAKPEPAPVVPPVAATKPAAPPVAANPPPASVAPAVPASPPPAAVAPRPAQPPAPASATPSPAQTSDTGAEDEEEDTTPEPTTLAAAPTSTTPAGHVTLRARQDSWVQIQSSDGVTVMARTLRAGDSYTVPDRPGLRLTTGNAGALDVMVDGQAAPPIGQIGTVRRNVALDPARLKAGTALE